MHRFAQPVILRNGKSMPRLGLGTYLATADKDEDTIASAIIKIGYRHIDTAALYKNERIIGKAIKKAMAAGINRNELFITTKLWNSAHGRVEDALKDSLERLQLDYVDLYLIHSPVAIKKEDDEYSLESSVLEKIPISDTWRGMEKVAQKGLAQSIGVSNFNFQLLNDLLTYARIEPVCNQIEIHPYLNQWHWVEWMKENNIQPVAYSPLGAAYISTEEKNQPMHDPVVMRIAEKYKKTPSQILINWGFSRGHVEIPKSSHLERIQENWDAQFFEMAPEDIEQLNQLSRNIRVWGGVARVGFIKSHPLFD